MRKLLVLLLLLVALPARAQLSQNQILPQWALGGGVVVSTSTSQSAKLGTIATSSLGLPTFTTLLDYLTLSAWYATTTDALDEGSNNLYYTDARVGSYITGSTTLPALLSFWTDAGTSLYPKGGESVSAPFFTATSTATSSFAGPITMEHPYFLTAHGIRGDASDGLYFTANNGTQVADFGLGNSANASFYGGVNIDGQTRLATSLTGVAQLTSGVVGVTTTPTFTGLSATGLTSALVQTDASGVFGEYAGTSCTNQFVRSLSALGIATCATVANTDLANSTVSYGGVTLSLGGSDATPAFNLVDATGLTVAGGGTGAVTLTGLLQGNGTGAITGVTGTAGQFPYFNGTNTLLATSSVFLTTAGNFGIGTTTPSATLTVQGTAGVNPFAVASSTGTNLVTVLPNGNVGIGISNPTQKLEFASQVAAERGAAFAYYFDDTQAGNINIRKARGTIASPTSVLSGDTIGGFGMQGYGDTAGTGGFKNAGFFRVFAEENFTNTAAGAYLQISTTPIGSTVVTERVRIDSKGHFEYSGTAPTISTCGTTPSVVGNDNAFTITTGTGAPTACTATFAGSWTNAPICNVTLSSGTATITTLSTSAITFTFSAGLTSGKVYVQCSGYR